MDNEDGRQAKPAKPKVKVKVKVKPQVSAAWKERIEQAKAAEEKHLASLPEVDRPVVLSQDNKFGVREFLAHFGLAKLRFNELRYEVEVEPERDLENWKLKKDVWQPLDKEDGDILKAMHVTAKAIGKVPPKVPKEVEDISQMKDFGMPKEDFYGCIAALAMDAQRYNAWTEFMRGLEPAEDDEFLFTAFKHCFGLRHTSQNGKGEINDYVRDAIRLPFTTMLLRQAAIADLEDEEGVHVRTSLMLRGPPGCGKSSFFAESFPKAVGASLYLQKLNIEKDWPDPEGRRTLGCAMAHTPEFHKYNKDEVLKWVGSHDLPADTMKVLYRQRPKYVIRGWAHTFSANSNNTMADVEAMNTRLAIVDVDWKRDDKGNELARRATEFFADPENGKRLISAAMAALKTFDPGKWDERGHGKVQQSQVKKTARVPHEGVVEKLQGVLSEKKAYKLDAVKQWAEIADPYVKDFKVVQCLEHLDFKKGHDVKGNWWHSKFRELDSIKEKNRVRKTVGAGRDSELQAALNGKTGGGQWD